MKEQFVEIYDFICDYRKEKGFSPSYRDIMRAVGIKSTSTVKYRLERMAFLRMVRNDGKPRTIVPLPKEEWREGA